MDTEKHEKADKLKEEIKYVDDFLDHVSGALLKGDDLKFSVTFSNYRGYYSGFSKESMHVALVLEKERLQKRLYELRSEYDAL